MGQLVSGYLDFAERQAEREQGAARVLGIDLSEKMIGKAWRSTIRRTWIGCLGGFSGR